MKDFMLIFIGADYQSLGLSAEQIQEQMGKWWAWQAKMDEAGIVKGGQALKPDAKRISGPDRTLSDGPFAESKEMVGGFYIVKAEDFEGAAKIAEDYPDYKYGGTVEIREVMVYEQ